MNDHPNHVLLTGGTGFLGKVVLEQLIRRASELGVARVYLLIRSKGNHGPDERFKTDVVASECFRLLPEGWDSRCTVIAGNVTAPDLGLTPPVQDRLAARITHIINCAASVDFDRPLEDAARSNIDGALATLAFAKRCTELQAMVHVSTAYVWPEQSAPPAFDQSLVPLPLDPAAVYADINARRANRDELLARTGHANTYTFTKCIAEHLLVANREHVPLRIVRPSIISTCRVHPFPGWVDSTTGFSGFVALFGGGVLRTLACRPDACLDVIPCDEVADRVLESTFSAHAAPIAHAVAGHDRTLPIRELIGINQRYFDRYPAGARAGFKHVGPWGRQFAFYEWLHTTLPHAFARALYALTRQRRKARGMRRLDGVVQYANRGFRYFTHATFDFRGAERGTVPAFDPREYHATIAEGVSRHLLGYGAEQAPLAGRRHTERESDLQWSLTQPRGNATHRFGAFILRKMWRRCNDVVTFDAPSFERAKAATQPGDLVVIVPTHRSYFDFLVLPYLFFARPELGIEIPHIAATEDFSRIPLISPLLRQGQAFFIRRGVGKADPDLTRRVAELAANGHTLTFFIEGTRSRSRRVLPPRRGLLRALQSTEKACCILPVAVSYDRIPDEGPLARELAGSKRPPHRLRSILRWVGQLRRGKVRLGRIHIRCGEPLRLDATTDVHALSHAIAGELQTATSISTFHLRAFLARCPLPDVSLVQLRRAVERRGGLVVDSTLPMPAHVDNALHECLLNQWRPLFFGDLRERAASNPALADHIAQHGWMTPVAAKPDVSPVPGLTEAMFGSIANGYAEVALYLAGRDTSEYFTGRAVADALPHVFRPDVELALQDMARRGLLAQHDDGFHRTGDLEATQAYERACAWPEADMPGDEQHGGVSSPATCG